jgi:hypothetical protein
MKKLLLATIAIIILLLTNPGVDIHRAAVTENTYKEMVLDGKSPIKLEAGPYTMLAIESKAAQGVTRKNFGLFSLTQYHFILSGHEVSRKYIGVGLIGQVYLWDTM